MGTVTVFRFRFPRGSRVAADNGSKLSFETRQGNSNRWKRSFSSGRTFRRNPDRELFVSFSISEMREPVLVFGTPRTSIHRRITRGFFTGKRSPAVSRWRTAFQRQQGKLFLVLFSTEKKSIDLLSNRLGTDSAGTIETVDSRGLLQ